MDLMFNKQLPWQVTRVADNWDRRYYCGSVNHCPHWVIFSMKGLSVAILYRPWFNHVYTANRAVSDCYTKVSRYLRRNVVDAVAGRLRAIKGRFK